jgi:Fe-S oxidoreductase
VIIRLVLGLLFTVVGLGVAGRRAWWLFRLIWSGQQAPGRLSGLVPRVRAQLGEVFGQRRLLKWSVPGLAHFFTFWGFLILMVTVVEAWGALFDRDFAFWWIGRQPWLGFLEDFFAVAVLVAVATFAVLRVRNAPERAQRASRFYGSHTGPAWVVLALITGVMVTLLLYRGAQFNTGHFPFGRSAWPFASWLVAHALAAAGPAANSVIETVFVLANVGVIMGFLVFVLHSKHLHIFVAPVNVAAKRMPDGLGPLLPMESRGKPIDFEDPSEDDIFGRGKVEDFTWKGMLDFATCTECGRCQSQCPAWNTGKPLSPKLVIMDLRDHLMAKAPYLIEGKPAPEQGSVEISPDGHDGHGVPESGFERVLGSGPEQAARPLVGPAEAGGVIDPDVLWSCTTCGACVEQCPVDIEHVDHIVDMRRYQVLMESEFPTELGALFRNLENKGNPWGQNNSERMDWAKDLDFEVPVFDGELGEEVEYVYWVGCAGAFDENARKTTRATAELLHLAGVNYVVLGTEETCTGDPARRSGNEFVFQMLAQQTAGQAGPGHRLVEATSGTLAEMPRHADRSLCCGAGGARMWMEEKIGKRVNLERVDEAIDTVNDQGAGTIATGCPFCRVMLGDGLVQRQSEDKGTNMTVRDVSQMLLESVKRGSEQAASTGTVER